MAAGIIRLVQLLIFNFKTKTVGVAGTPATQFLPPSLAGYAKSGVPTYSYNPSKSIALLKQAGLTPPVKVWSSETKGALHWTH